MIVNVYLLIDFGSTFTKLTAVDIDNEIILATSRDRTTVETDIMIGYKKAYIKLMDSLKGVNVNFVKKLACSSAAGGLKMVAIGLVPELTAEAAKRAALGAGARVLKVFDHELTKRDISEIEKLNSDMILLAGGTDGGNKECITINAFKIAESDIKVPVVLAGNKAAIDLIESEIESFDDLFRVTDNVMPKLNILNVEPAREIIREIFMDQITEAKGMGVAKLTMDGILMPTPAAVLKASTLLSVGTDNEDGLGDLLVVDIGGATTDVHSIGLGEPTMPGVTLKGLEEPFAKRTVEGDLGMRYSAYSLWEASGSRKIRRYLGNNEIDIEQSCKELSSKVDMVPESNEEASFDVAIAKVAVELSIERHVGRIETIYTPLGVVSSQIGKDLSNINYMIGTGGVLVESDKPIDILNAGLMDDDILVLKPKNPKMLLDEKYIFSAMGLLAQDFPDKALRIMKKNIVDCNR